MWLLLHGRTPQKCGPPPLCESRHMYRHHTNRINDTTPCEISSRCLAKSLHTKHESIRRPFQKLQLWRRGCKGNDRIAMTPTRVCTASAQEKYVSNAALTWGKQDLFWLCFLESQRHGYRGLLGKGLPQLLLVGLRSCTPHRRVSGPPPLRICPPAPTARPPIRAKCHRDGARPRCHVEVLLDARAKSRDPHRLPLPTQMTMPAMMRRTMMRMWFLYAVFPSVIICSTTALMLCASARIGASASTSTSSGHSCGNTSGRRRGGAAGGDSVAG